MSHNFQIPSKRINSGSDVQFFHTTKAYRDIVSFIMQLNRSVCPRFNSDNKQVRAFPLIEEEEEEDEAKYPESVKRLRKMLERVGKIIEEVPAEEYADRRFGNRAFRVWWKRLEGERGLLGGLGLEGVDKKEKGDEEDEEMGGVIKVEDGSKRELTKEEEKRGQVAEKDELGVYFMGSWGSAERLDYGTGHELSFLAFLGGLWKLGYFGDSPGEEVERAIVLGVVEM
jgi:serine/threonine-protein phosphatase 2A activator